MDPIHALFKTINHRLKINASWSEWISAPLKFKPSKWKWQISKRLEQLCRYGVDSRLKLNHIWTHWLFSIDWAWIMLSTAFNLILIMIFCWKSIEAWISNLLNESWDKFFISTLRTKALDYVGHTFMWRILQLLEAQTKIRQWLEGTLV